MKKVSDLYYFTEQAFRGYFDAFIFDKYTVDKMEYVDALGDGSFAYINVNITRSYPVSQIEYNEYKHYISNGEVKEKITIYDGVFIYTPYNDLTTVCSMEFTDYMEHWKKELNKYKMEILMEYPTGGDDD